MEAQKYKRVELTFYDHKLSAPEDSGPIVCVVTGALWKQDNLCYYVVPWVCGSDISDSNNEVYTVLKSAVTKVRRLK